MPKILYVEDNDDNVFVMRGRLTRSGFEVVVAADGEQGRAMSEAAAPDLILDTKPVDFPKLVERIQTILTRGRQP